MLSITDFLVPDLLSCLRTTRPHQPRHRHHHHHHHLPCHRVGGKTPQKKTKEQILTILIYCGLSVPVCRCGEDAEDDVTAVHVYDGTGGVQHVEVEVGISRHGAVESGLQEGRPLLLQHALRSALVALTHPGHTGHHNLHPDN